MNKQIPEGWRKSSIGEITSTNSLFSDGDWVESKDQDPTGANRLIQLADIGDGIFINKSSRYMNDEQFERLKCTALEKNDILIARMPEPLGRACLYPLEGGKAATVVDVAILRTKNANHYWLMSAINSSDYRHQIDLNASGTTRTRIARGVLSNIEILEPPLPEQQKIATILSSVDDVIEKTRAQIDKLKDLKTGMMQELLTKGIGHTEFKDSPVGRIPAAWEIAGLGDIVLAKGIQTGPFGSQLHSHEYIEWGVPVIMPRDMKGNKIDPASVAHIPLEKAVELDKHRVEVGDLVFARRGDIGRFALVDKSNEGWVCGTGCLKVRLQPSVSPAFIASYLTLTPVIEWLNTNAVGQTMLNLNTSILSELPIILPPEHEQAVIGEAILSLDNKVASRSDKLSGLLRVKKALMQDLLTGKVRVEQKVSDKVG